MSKYVHVFVAAGAAATMRWVSSGFGGKQGRWTAVTSQGFRKAVYCLFGDLLGRIPEEQPWRLGVPNRVGLFVMKTFKNPGQAIILGRENSNFRERRLIRILSTS